MTIESRSVIDTTLSHADYEKIKENFREYRNKAGMQYAFNKSHETDTIMHHEWHGAEDSLLIDFKYDKSKRTETDSGVIDATIHYIFTEKSTIAGYIYGMLLLLDSTTTIHKEESSLKNEEDIMKKVLKANFLSSIHPGDYSDTFINGTLRCIDEGILTHIMTLHLLPFSSPSHFITKGEYKTEISDVEDRKGDVESGTSIKS